MLEAAENFSAKHGAIEIDKAEDDRFVAEVVAEADGAAKIVAEGEVERQKPIQILLDGDVLESGRTQVGGRRHNPVSHALAEGACGCERDDRREFRQQAEN